MPSKRRDPNELPERKGSVVEKPWNALEDVLGSEDPDRVAQFFEGLSSADTALALSRVAEESRERALSLLHPEQAAHLLTLLSDEQAADILSEIPVDPAAAIVEELPSDERVDLLAELSSDEAEAILNEMPAEDAERARELLGYDEESAGGLMVDEYLAFDEELTVSQVLDDLRENRDQYSDYDVQYAYITDGRGHLRGVLRLRDLILSEPGALLSSVMIANPTNVSCDTPLDELHAFFESHSFLGVPVLEGDGRLVGVVLKEAVFEAAEERASQTFLRFGGIIGGEELRSMPLHLRCLRRLAFLGPNILLNLVAVTVIARHQDTLEAVIALAVFLPIVSDMSGCSGNQAVAVSIRELTLGLLRPNEFLRIVFKEGAVGIINGIVLGILLGTIAAVWMGPPALGLVIGSALALNTIVSVLLGGSVPLLLRKLKVDPALASGPVLTTVTDMCGFFLVLTLASTAMEHLMAA